jgi:ATP-dependent RNA helicase A
MDKKRMEEAEDVDVNAGIHGNWTMENAKSMLHQFLQVRRIKTDYKYGRQGSSFVAEMAFYVKVNNKSGLISTGTGIVP